MAADAGERREPMRDIDLFQLALGYPLETAESP